MPWLNRVDGSWLKNALSACKKVLVLDNHYSVGGQGDLIARALVEAGINIEYRLLGVDEIPPSGTNQQVLQAMELDSAAIVRAIYA